MGKKRTRSEENIDVPTSSLTTTILPSSSDSAPSTTSLSTKAKPQKSKTSKVVSSPSDTPATIVADIALLKSFTPSNPTLSDRLNPTHPHYDKKLKTLWSQLPKKERQKIIQADKDALVERSKIVTAAVPSEYAFQTSEEDHCETGLDAFKDITSVLTIFNKVVLERPSTSLADLAIYDPYYCTGSSQRHLNSLGFNNVYHKNEDFYQQVYKRTNPSYDILVTNPAYSNDHIPRLLHLLANNLDSKPFLLLMPCFVLNKDYWKKACEQFTCFRECIYFYPLKRYNYWTPKGLRSKQQTHSSVAGNRTSPYVSMWYAYFGNKHKEMIDKLCNNKYQRSIPNSNLRIALKIDDLPPVMQPAATSIANNPVNTSSSTTMNKTNHGYNNKEEKNINKYTTSTTSTSTTTTSSNRNSNHLTFDDDNE